MGRGFGWHVCGGTTAADGPTRSSLWIYWPAETRYSPRCYTTVRCDIGFAERTRYTTIIIILKLSCYYRNLLWWWSIKMSTIIRQLSRISRIMMPSHFTTLCRKYPHRFKIKDQTLIHPTASSSYVRVHTASSVLVPYPFIISDSEDHEASRQNTAPNCFMYYYYRKMREET